MTKTVTVQERGSEGDHRYAIVEVDITSLDSAGAEPFDPATVLGFSNAEGHLVDAEEPRRDFRYDPDNTEIRVRDRGPRLAQKSEDPGSQTYSGGTETEIASFNPGDASSLWPLNFNPTNISDSGTSMILRAVYHDGSTTDLVDIGDGSEQTFENLVDGFATGDDGLGVDALKLIVDTNAGDVTTDIGNSTLEFLAWDADAANNADVGTATFKFIGDYSA